MKKTQLYDYFFKNKHVEIQLKNVVLDIIKNQKKSAEQTQKKLFEGQLNNSIAIWNYDQQQIDYLVLNDFDGLNNYVQTTDLQNVLLSYQPRIFQNSPVDGQILIWDALNNKISYTVLSEFNNFSNYTLTTDLQNILLDYQPKIFQNNPVDGQILIWDSLNNEIGYTILSEFDNFSNYTTTSQTETTIQQMINNYDATVQTTYYNKQYVDNFIQTKSDLVANYYNSSAVDEKLNLKQNNLLGLSHLSKNILGIDSNNTSLVWLSIQDFLKDVESFETLQQRFLVWNFADQKIKWLNFQEANVGTETQQNTNTNNISLLQQTALKTGNNSYSEKYLKNYNFVYFLIDVIGDQTGNSNYFAVTNNNVATYIMKLYTGTAKFWANNYNFYNTAETQQYLQISPSNTVFKNNNYDFQTNSGSVIASFSLTNCDFKTNNLTIQNSVSAFSINPQQRTISNDDCEVQIKMGNDNKLQISSKTNGRGMYFFAPSTTGEDIGINFMNEFGTLLGQLKFSYVGQNSVVINGTGTRIVEFELDGQFISYVNASGTITTSDKNKKCKIDNLKQTCFSCYFDDVEGLFNSYQFLSDVEKKTKLGYIAQDFVQFVETNKIACLKDSYDVIDKPCVDENGLEHQSQFGLDYNHIQIFFNKVLHNKIKTLQNTIKTSETVIQNHENAIKMQQSQITELQIQNSQQQLEIDLLKQQLQDLISTLAAKQIIQNKIQKRFNKYYNRIKNVPKNCETINNKMIKKCGIQSCLKIIFRQLQKLANGNKCNIYRIIKKRIQQYKNSQNFAQLS